MLKERFKIETGDFVGIKGNFNLVAGRNQEPMMSVTDELFCKEPIKVIDGKISYNVNIDRARIQIFDVSGDYLTIHGTY